MSTLTDLGPATTVMLDRISEVAPVKWDRLVEDGPRLTVYGWIPKPCAVCDGRGAEGAPENLPICPACDGEGTDGKRADFVLVYFEPHLVPGALTASYFTSSAEHSKAIASAIWGPKADDLHIDCQRVEDVLPEVKAAIKLDA